MPRSAQWHVTDRQRRKFLAGGARACVYRLTYVLLALAASIGQPSAAAAQDMAVPIDQQLPLLSKVLTYDRNHAARAEGALVIGVIYQTGVRVSRRAMEAVAAWVDHNTGRTRQQPELRCVPIALTDTTDLRAAIRRHHVDVLYVAPLRAAKLSRITAVTRREKVLTITGVVSYVRAGIAVGIDEDARRMKILINLPASRDEGSEFTSQLLAVSKVINGEGE